MLPVTPEIRRYMTQVYAVSLRDVKLLVMSDWLIIQADWSCLIVDAVIDERFLERVKMNEDLLVISYEPGRIVFTSKAMKAWYTQIVEALAKARLLGLE